MVGEKEPPDLNGVPVNVEMGTMEQGGDADNRRTVPNVVTAQAESGGHSSGTASNSSVPANATNPTNTEAIGRTPRGELDQTYAEASRTPAWHGAAALAQEDESMDKVQRPYVQQVEEAMRNRNIIELNLQELNGRGNSIPLSETDIAVIFFDMLNIRPQDATRIATRTSSFTTREIELKPTVNAADHLNNGEYFTYKGEWRILATTQCVRWTRVTFRDVPLNVEDEEIVHLCTFYGEVRKKTVMQEQAGAATRGVKKSTRYVDMRFSYGAYLNNFYWMEGPLEGDKPARIRVSHPQQPQQCSHCLQQPRMSPQGPGCAEGAFGSACRDAGGRRADIEEYSQHLFLKHGYRSLKRIHLFRNMQMQGGATRRNDGFVSQLNNQKKPSTKKQTKKKQTPPAQTQDTRLVQEDDLDAPPYDPNADTGPDEITLDNELTHPPIRPGNITPSSTGTIAQTAGPTNANQDPKVPENEYPVLPPFANISNNPPTTPSPLSTNPPTQQPTIPSNHAPEHRPDDGDTLTPVEPTPGQADNPDTAQGIAPEEPTPSQIHTTPSTALTDPNLTPSQNSTHADAANTVPAPVTPPPSTEETGTPTAAVAPMLPTSSQNTDPPSTPMDWAAEMAESQNRTPEHITNIFSSMEDAPRQPADPDQHPQGPPEEQDQPDTDQPGVGEHQDTSQEQPVTPQQQPPVTRVAKT